MERMQNFKSDNQHIDVQLVSIAEASKQEKNKNEKKIDRLSRRFLM
jgi:hypothetical protein